MKDKVYYILGAVLLCFSAFLLVNALSPKSVITLTYYDSVAEDAHERVEELYKLSFTMKKARPDSMVSYVPEQSSAFFEDAENILNKFSMKDFTVTETEESAVYENGEASVEIYKFWKTIVYENYIWKTERHEKITPLKAAGIAREFLKERVFNYSGITEIAPNDSGGFDVSFYYKFAGVLCRAFPTVVSLDGYGNVFKLSYNETDYDKLGVSKIKTMREAYYGLSADADEKADLKKCELVYFYADSVVQPVYLFSGERGGKSFTEFVRAAKY
ncbi:hypothetical protein FACS189490_06280 [Clostridia bacterium]|nr:hypothetical protein FACS189490_06280 [Clostridia bacterium]